MKFVGLIAEYNPFHLGHQAQLRDIRAALGEDTAIVVLQSAYFTQHGVPALLSPHERAAAAVAGGADLVLQMPQLFSLQSAEGFAQSFVQSLQQLSALRYLAFGTESGQVERLQRSADLLLAEPEGYREELHRLLREGLPYYAARTAALEQYMAEPGLADFLREPNHILALEYLKQNRRPEARALKVLCLKRHGRAEHSLTVDGEAYASATALRARVAEACRVPNPDLLGLAKTLRQDLPQDELATLLARLGRGGYPDPEALTPLFLNALETLEPATAETLLNWDADLARRVGKLLPKYFYSDAPALYEALQCRHYPLSRLRRALLALVLRLQIKDVEAGPAYLLSLAFNKRGKYVLKRLQNEHLPLLATFSESQNLTTAAAERQARIDRAAAGLWARLAPNPHHDLLESPVFLRF